MKREQPEKETSGPGIKPDPAKLERDEGRISDALEFNRAILQTSPVGVVVYLLTGQCVFANKAAAELVGGAVDGLLALNFHHIPSWKNSGLYAAATEAIANDTVQHVDALVSTTFGKNVWLGTRFKVFQHGDEKYLLVLIADITERKMMAQNLQRKISELDTFLNNIPDMAWLKDRDSNFIALNKAFSAMAGKDPAYLVSRTCEACFGKEAAEKFKADDRSVMAGGKQVIIHESVRNARGETVYLETIKSPLFSESGEVAGTVGIARDITERKKMEARISSLNACFLGFSADSVENIKRLTAACGESLGAACALYNRLEGNMLSSVGQWNTPPDYNPLDKYEGHICYDVITRKSEDVFFVRNLPQTHYFKTDPNVARYGLVTYIGSVVKAGGRNVGCLCALFQKDVVPTDEEKEFIGIVASAIGVEEDRLRAQEELRASKVETEKALDELRRTEMQIIQHERLSALGQMASGISHDFNNALMPILGLSDYLLEHREAYRDEDEMVDMLNSIRTAARNAAQTVKRLRDFYRPQEDMAMARINVAAVVEHVKRMLQPRWKTEAQAEGRTIEIEVDVEEGLEIAVNESQLRDAMTNLFLNSIDAMPRGGLIRINASIAGDDWAEIRIKDNGTGMSETVKKRCLEPFFTTKGKHGMGMGLPIVHGIVARHGGNISVESETGKGTTVLIRLPTKAAREAESNGEEKVGAAPPVRVLVIDDEEVPLRIIARFLTTDGHEVKTAQTGQEGVEIFKHGQFDLVMTDRAMPVMNGDEVARAVKKIAPQVPVILVTGFGDMMKAGGERPSWIDYILEKPVTVADLRKALASVIKR